MAKKDPRVDAYIEKSAPFAQPILRHLRKLVHKTCPSVKETMKWSFPHFDYEGMFCGMAAFKQHCSFGFWKAALMQDADKLLDKQNEAMGHLGKITSLKELPPDKKIVTYILEAMKLNEEKIKVVKKKKPSPKKIESPGYFMDALCANKQALAHFERFSNSDKKEYVEWITEAKREETRSKRLAEAVEWIAEGKKRYWKYMG